MRFFFSSLILLLCTVNLTFGQIPLGDEFTLYHDTAYINSHVSIVEDSLNNYLLVWESKLKSSGETEIYIQHLNPDGAAASSIKCLTCTYPGTHGKPIAAMDEAGNFVICWLTDTISLYLNNPHLQAIRYSATSSSFGLLPSVNSIGSSVQINAKIAMNRAGGSFVIGYRNEDENAGSGKGFYIQRYDASGTPLGTNNITSQYNMEIALNPKNDNLYQLFGSGGVLFVETDTNNQNVYWNDVDYQASPQRMSLSVSGELAFVTYYDDDDNTIYHVVINTTENWSRKFPIRELEVTPWQIHTSVNEHGEQAITWSEYYSSDQLYHMKLLILSETYEISGEIQAVRSTASDTTGIQRVSFASDSKIMLAWTNHYSTSSNRIGARQYHVPELPFSRIFELESSDEAFKPKVACDADGNFVLAWFENVDNPSFFPKYKRIKIRKFNQNGNPLTDVVSLTSDTLLKRNLNLAMNENGSLFISWYQSTSYYKIYDSDLNVICSKTALTEPLQDSYILSADMKGNGDILVLWTGDDGPHECRLNLSGTLIGNHISTPWIAQLCMNEQGKYFSYREDWNTVASDMYHTLIYHSGFNELPSDTLYLSSIEYGTDNHSDISINMDMNGKQLLTVSAWQEGSVHPKHFYGSVYDFSVNTLYPLGLLNDSNNFNRYDYSASINNLSFSTIVWDDLSSYSYSSCIHFQVFNPYRQSLFERPFAIGSAPGTGSPEVASSDNNVIVCWHQLSGNGSKGLIKFRILQLDGYLSSGIPESTRDSKVEDLLIYPNPVSDKLFITVSNKSDRKQQVLLFDASGKLIYSELHYRYDLEIPVDNLNAGIYFIQTINSSGENRTGKFIKTN
jgi:hypothetical protein